MAPATRSFAGSSPPRTRRDRGYHHLEIGFKWFYRTGRANERAFWEHLRDRGGKPFLRSLDWIGLDAYPGTFLPPFEPTLDDYRDGMVNAMSTLRCLARIAGILQAIRMHVEKNGWPTGPGRTPERQDEVARAMIEAVHDFRGTYNVTDYRWFNLRDADSSDPRISQQYGLMRDDYSEKPAFGVYCRLVAALSCGNPGEGPGGGARSLFPRRRWRRLGPAGDHVDGTSGDDVLRGTSGDDTIRCGAGHDRLEAGAGDELVLCGPGDDVVRGNSGHDVLAGGSGGDRLFGESGDDRLDTRDGTGGNDSALGASGTDVCRSDRSDDCRP